MLGKPIQSQQIEFQSYENIKIGALRKALSLSFLATLRAAARERGELAKVVYVLFYLENFVLRLKRLPSRTGT